jgi:rhamnose transport system ATP-binding protein
MRGERPLGNISLTVRTGEIVGLAGLVGAGRTELLETIFGVRPAASGHVRLHGRALARGPSAAAAAGMALVPEDRKRTGLALDLSVSENLAMARLAALYGAGYLGSQRQHRLAEPLIERLRIKCAGPAAAAATLSGGNQQKIVLGKWLARDPAVLLLDEPTRGVDVGAKAEIHRILRGLAQGGMAILMASSDMTELLALCDRVLVMCEGRIQGELTRQEMTEESILHLATPGYAAAHERVYGG